MLKSRARFAAHVADETIRTHGLRASHPALREGRSIFDVTRDAIIGEPVLISGHNQRKIGDTITKGDWAGLPVYTLSLEERATCPRSCKQWVGCYGNQMPFARRWKHGEDFECALLTNLARLGRKHREGFAVRVHVLGDFYSVQYVNVWREALSAIPGLHIWGYTARETDTQIGTAVQRLNKDFPTRCAIRFSGTETVVITSADKAGEAIVCPVETGASANCGSCGLCWSKSARSKVIAFIFHGMKRRKAA